MKNKIIIITILTIIVSSLFAVTVNAADLSFNTLLDTNKETLEKGKEVTITLNVFDLNVGDKGINSLNGYLEYDDKVFEEVSADDIEGLNKWNATYSESGKISLLKTSFVNKSEDICKIKLKVKSDTNSKKTTITFKDIVASNSSDSEITSETSTLELPIEESSSEGGSIKISSGNNTSTDTNTNTNTNSNESSSISTITANTNSNRNNTDNTNTDNTNTGSSLITSSSNYSNNSSNNTNTNLNEAKNETKEEEMPNTGIDDTIVKAIILVSLIAVLGYIKLKSIEKR